MLAPSKRRASLFTLPLVIVIGFLSVAGLAAWQRSDVIAELADQVAHGEKAEATAAVRQLAAMPGPPLATLVEAATSDEHATAEAAQVAINRLLSKWQRQIDKKERVSTISRDLSELAAALSSQKGEFPRTDYPWLASATRKILRIANQCPAKRTPLVALHCDEIMEIVGTALNSDVIPASASTIPPGETDARAAQHQQLEQEFSEISTQPLTNQLRPSVNESESSGSQLERTSVPSSTGLPVEDSSQMASPPKPIQPPSPQNSPVPIPKPIDSAASPKWSEPAFRILPAVPINARASEGSAGKPDVPPIKMPQPRSPLHSQQTQKLLRAWEAAPANDRPAIAEELARRGFEHLPAKLIRQFLSEDLAERSRIVDTVLTEPNVDGRPWLLLLADDQCADVRLLAVTVMATSNDTELVEKAWDTAIRDRDPRIADLAARLRDRRTGITSR